MKPTLFSSLATAVLLMTAKGAVITGSVSTFSGPDDLLLDPATNVVAVDTFGSNGSLSVNGVTFQSDAATGSVSGGGATVTSTATNMIDGWTTAPTYTGTDAASVANLSAIMHDIRWELSPGILSVEVTGLTPGTLYNVQLLFSENGSSSDRHWDIGVDGALVVDDYNTNGTTASLGSVYSGNFDPGADGTLNILMGNNPFPDDPNNTPTVGLDNNPILNGLIIHTAIPEPGSLALLGLGLSSLFLRRRRG